MNSLAYAYLSSPTLPSLKVRLAKPPFTFSSSVSNLKPFHLRDKASSNLKRIGNGICRAEMANDAPFAVAIGACILSSLVLPMSNSGSDDESDAMDSTDTRLAVMSIISFIPYFNWLSWVFAWLDTGRRLYAVYALVYLAPYIRSNLSLSPEESWLPIASLALCIIHVQIEVGIKNGDIQGFQIFEEASKQISSLTKGRDHSKGSQGLPKERRKKEHNDLPSAEEQLRDETRRWADPKESSDDHKQRKGDWDDEQRKKH